MKTKEELIALKEKVETLNKKLAELTEEELAQVTGGSFWPPIYVNKCPFCGSGCVSSHVEGSLVKCLCNACGEDYLCQMFY